MIISLSDLESRARGRQVLWQGELGKTLDLECGGSLEDAWQVLLVNTNFAMVDESENYNGLKLTNFKLNHHVTFLTKIHINSE